MTNLHTPKRRIEIDADGEAVRIAGSVMHELCAHALEAQPEECCGLVIGRPSDRFSRVVRCRNEMTARHRSDPQAYPRDGTQAFYMSEVDYLRAMRTAESDGHRVTAVYHSHVGAGAYLSEMDLSFAEHSFFPFPDAAQIVLAVWDRSVAQVGIFERDQKNVFAGLPLEVRSS